ncbi:hypothetical protein K458DRAFT_492095 [Lentithecium fluviatile CBS 122367]|uniref:Heterokaryon incompatibility domain-containing protein n=1 Tax=Lentithecium fluviatile CBS 122367 TaxID=1168545 RepID=A0A6G1IFR2_9PLEO|nr:hypothetical protein K458DRAFT_492095 [Lentithecium fluviatile CBS 122367]
MRYTFPWSFRFLQPTTKGLAIDLEMWTAKPLMELVTGQHNASIMQILTLLIVVVQGHGRQFIRALPSIGILLGRTFTIFDIGTGGKLFIYGTSQSPEDLRREREDARTIEVRRGRGGYTEKGFLVRSQDTDFLCDVWESPYLRLRPETSLPELRIQKGETMTPYTYTPLPTPTSIRVLRFPKLDPTSGKLSTSFRIIDLAHNPKPLYHALSYTWGNPHADGPFFANNYVTQTSRYATQDSIIVDGHILAVNRNLHDALLSMKPDYWRRFCNSRTKRMRSQLHFAVLLRRVGYMRALVKSGVDLDLVDDSAGWTPLMYAAASGEAEMVRMLLAAGADVTVAAENGETARKAAMRNGWEEIAGWVEDAAKMDLKQRRDKFGSGKKDAGGLDEDGPDRWIWIDQLCINQEDLKERGAQVSMMGDIYSGAFWTLVWLGAADDHTATALQAINKLMDAEGDLVNSDILPYIEDQPESVYAAAKIPYISEAEWDALAALFQRQYFRRMWVVQENLLSQTTLGLCGDIELPWRQLCDVAQQLYIRQVVIGRPTSAKYIDNGRGEAALQVEYRASQLVQWSDRWLNGERAANPKPCNLGTLVGDCWTFRATDARDKIFGFYGLFNLQEKRKVKQEGRDEKAGGKVAQMGGAIRDGTAAPKDRWIADYSKPTAQVFAEATKTILKEAGDLGILADVIDVSLKQTVDLPSWSPDFSVPFTNALPFQHNASESTDPYPVPDLSDDPINWSRLPVSVRKLDSVMQIGPTTSGPGDTTIYFSREWVSLALLLPTPYQDTGLSRTEVLWRTLTADSAITGARPAPVDYGSAFRELVSTMICLAAREEAQRFAQIEPEEGKVLRLPECPTPSLEIAVEHVKTTWQNPVFTKMNKAELLNEFGEVGQNLSGERWQGLVFVLMGLHVLALTEMEGEDAKEESRGRVETGSKLFTPTLDQILAFEEQIALNELSKENGGGVKLLPGNNELLHVLRRTMGRRRLFVTNDRLLGIGPAGMREGDCVVLIRGFGSPVVVREVRGENGRETEEKSNEGKEELEADQKEVNKSAQTEESSGSQGSEEWEFIGQAFVFGVLNEDDAGVRAQWERIRLV